jgi:hypothetical protein
MSRSGPPDPRASLTLVPRALLGSSAAVLAVAAFVNQQGLLRSTGAETVSWMAAGFAALAPFLATAVRGQGLVAPPPASSETHAELTARLQKTIVFFGVLESAVVFCAVALMVSPPVWPLVAALLPLLVMLLNLPPRQG